MKKSLDDPVARDSILSRISRLTPGSPRKWGRMSAHQMMCHLTDSYCGVIGERSVSAVKLPIPQPVFRWLMLNTPWPKGAPTRPELDQFAGGTPPVEFDADRVKLTEAIDRFCTAHASARVAHPAAGKLSHADWMRWGYLHADHHLRQFGV